MNCEVCNIVDSIEHYFYHCPDMLIFWTNLCRWINNVFNCSFKLGCLDVIFGVMDETNDDMLHVLNYCILFAKQFIYSLKSQLKPCTIESFIFKLKNRITIEKYIAELNGTLECFIKRWQQIDNRM